MSTFRGSRVLVTGGCSGIGKLLAEKAISAGASHVIIWDINEEALEGLRVKRGDDGASIHPFHVDLADKKRIYSVADDISTTIGPVDILFNNAGIIHGGWFHEQPADAIEASMRVNTLGAMHTARAVLPGMIEQGRGHIVNISSAASLIANPQMATYVASKWALTGWSESLRLEMEQLEQPIQITTVQPGYIDTGMFDNVTAPRLTPILSPDAVTDAILEAVRKNKIILRKPFMVKLTPFLKGILPARVFDFVAGKLFRVYSSMHSFTTRGDTK